MTVTLRYPSLGGDYRFTISGSGDKVCYVLEKLEYFSLSELNEKDLDGVKIEEEYDV